MINRYIKKNFKKVTIKVQYNVSVKNPSLFKVNQNHAITNALDFQICYYQNILLVSISW